MKIKEFPIKALSSYFTDYMRYSQDKNINLSNVKFSIIKIIQEINFDSEIQQAELDFLVEKIINEIEKEIHNLT